MTTAARNSTVLLRQVELINIESDMYSNYNYNNIEYSMIDGDINDNKIPGLQYKIFSFLLHTPTGSIFNFRIQRFFILRREGKRYEILVEGDLIISITNESKNRSTATSGNGIRIQLSKQPLKNFISSFSFDRCMLFQFFPASYSNFRIKFHTFVHPCTKGEEK